MSSPEVARDHGAPAAIFSALGDETRLALIDRLSDGQTHSIIRLTEGLGLTRQGVTKHLRVLQKAGLVRSQRKGRESRYALSPEPVQAARSYLDRVAAEWDEALRSLKAFVEAD
jgi:DNA-binding transcriptional ArsR family regulator